MSEENKNEEINKSNQNIPQTPVKKHHILSILILILVSVFTFGIIYLGIMNNQLKNDLSLAQSEIQKLQTTLANQDNNVVLAELDSQKQKYSDLSGTVSQYLSVNSESCPKGAEISSCLTDKIEKLSEVEGPECSATSDSVCPKWCSAGADYDCCVQEDNSEWIKGRGCYSISPEVTEE